MCTKVTLIISCYWSIFFLNSLSNRFVWRTKSSIQRVLSRYVKNSTQWWKVTFFLNWRRFEFHEKKERKKKKRFWNSSINNKSYRCLFNYYKSISAFLETPSQFLEVCCFLFSCEVFQKKQQRKVLLTNVYHQCLRKCMSKLQWHSSHLKSIQAYAINY